MVDTKYLNPAGLTEYIFDTLFNSNKDNEYYYNDPTDEDLKKEADKVKLKNIISQILSWILFFSAFYLSWTKNHNLKNAERFTYAFIAGLFNLFYIIYYFITVK